MRTKENVAAVGASEIGRIVEEVEVVGSRVLVWDKDANSAKVANSA
jgi:hypothetical protein